MIAAVLIAAAAIIATLEKTGAVESGQVLFWLTVVVVLVAAYVFRSKLTCPLTKICPLTFCPLNKKKK